MAPQSRWFEPGSPLRTPWRLLRLRHAALTYARHGWRVIAGSRLCGTRFSCGPGCHTVSCHPIEHAWDVDHQWDATGLTDPDTVAEYWRDVPHSVLLATGDRFDAVEVPAHLGALATRVPPGPVIVTPSGSWLFLVEPGEPLHPDLAALHDVVLHGVGSWIPAPPVRMPEGRVRWAVSPHETDWRLPDPRAVQSALARPLPPQRPARRVGTAA